MKVLFIGDIIGKPGRKVVKEKLPEFIEAEKVRIVIANGENSAGGFGITPKVCSELFNDGVNVITTGNHVWDRKEVYDIIDKYPIIRPANFPPSVPGRGYLVKDTKYGIKVGIINLQGRVYMANLDCPFRCSDKIIENIKKETPIIIVDFHAEITSEKIAMGWYLDGKVSAVIGTHTHVQTADERILPEGTAYITDVGMTGPRDSVIGVKKDIILKRYLTSMPIRFEVANEDLVLSGVMLDIDDKTGKALSIRRFVEGLGTGSFFPSKN